jgi:hypothetical protein
MNDGISTPWISKNYHLLKRWSENMQTWQVVWDGLFGEKSVCVKKQLCVCRRIQKDLKDTKLTSTFWKGWCWEGGGITLAIIVTVFTLLLGCTRRLLVLSKRKIYVGFWVSPPKQKSPAIYIWLKFQSCSLGCLSQQSAQEEAASWGKSW